MSWPSLHDQERQAPLVVPGVRPKVNRQGSSQIALISGADDSLCNEAADSLDVNGVVGSWLPSLHVVSESLGQGI